MRQDSLKHFCFAQCDDVLYREIQRVYHDHYQVYGPRKARSIGTKIGCTSETPRKRVRQTERDAGSAPSAQLAPPLSRRPARLS